MKKNYTHISVILDRTGSMASIRDDIIGGFNTFLNEQKDQPGEATLTLVQFDSKDPFEVIHHFEQIKDIPELTHKTYRPRASTPLLDAIGRGINDLEKSLAELREEDRPSRVMMVVITDGRENSSREFRKDQIEKMIKERIDKDDWQFVFLSSDLAAIGDARSVGVRGESTLLFRKNGKGTSKAWASLSSRTSDYRSARNKRVDFDQKDREHPDDPQKNK